LNVARPDDDGNRQAKTQPEFVPKHRNGVAGVSIVAALIVRHLVTGVWVRRVCAILVCRRFHLEKL
jgi:hypothetical protein